VDGQNKILILLDLSPSDLSIWDQVNFMDLIQINSPFPITDYQVVRNLDGTVSIMVGYSEDIQGQKISVSINPNNTGLAALSRSPPTQTSLVIVPDDN
jgi:hypothetical protein